MRGEYEQNCESPQPVERGPPSHRHIRELSPRSLND
jgi:hypothetical protein